MSRQFSFILAINFLVAMTGCSTIMNYGRDTDAPELIGKCFKFMQPTFVFEAHCADITGFNNSTERCMSVQAAGVGGFPVDWPQYLRIRESFDRRMFFSISLFRKRETMVAILDEGTELHISKALIHYDEPPNHLTDNFRTAWVARGIVMIDGAPVEVELPSYHGQHWEPYWIDGSSDDPLVIDSEYLDGC